MKKLLLITIILLLQSFSSFGEWKKLHSDNEGVYFIDVNTIRKNGDLIYFNDLTDFYKPHSIDNSLSRINREVINCKTKERKRLRSIYYFDSMGKGKITEEFKNPIDTGSFQMGSVIGSYYKFLCK